MSTERFCAIRKDDPVRQRKFDRREGASLCVFHNADHGSGELNDVLLTVFSRPFGIEIRGLPDRVVER